MSLKELEIRLRLTKEQIIYELQVLVVYSKVLTKDQVNTICKIFTAKDVDEIVEERAATTICCSPYCRTEIKKPEKAPIYEYNPKKKIYEKYTGIAYCSPTCEKALEELKEQVSKTTKSHQLRSVQDYCNLCELWKTTVVKLGELKTQLITLAKQCEEEMMTEGGKTKEKKEDYVNYV